MDSLLESSYFSIQICGVVLGLQMGGVHLLVQYYIPELLSDGWSLKRKVSDDAGDGGKRVCLTGAIRLAENMSDKAVIKKLNETWRNNQGSTQEAIEILSQPFQLGKISGVLADDQIIHKLVDEMAEQVTWTRRQTDFLELNQSCDLISICSPELKKFYEFLNTNMISWMREVTGLNLTHVSANCSMYNHGDHLLVHDDCIADRKIAFVFYLSPWVGHHKWTEEMGGALELFVLDDGQTEPKFPVAKTIPPVNNQMVFFRVCDKSFHQVGEVLSTEFPRLTINGWFHGPGAEFEAQVKDNPLFAQLRRPNEIDFDLTEWINETYLQNKSMLSIQAEIEEESQICLTQFLIPEFAQLITDELGKDGLQWQRSYSACERNYEHLVWESTKGPLRDLKNLFESQAFFKLMFNYTSLDFAGQHAKEPKCFVELQRWTNASYTMLVNETKETYLGNVLDLTLYLNGGDERVGKFIYVNNGDDDEGENEEEGGHSSENNDVLLTVEPKANSLNMVYCSEGTSRFGKYVSKAVDMKGTYVYILSCSFKE